MDSWKRKLRMGMVGGGQGAFIGWVHRMAAALDQQVDFVAGCFSRDFENTKTTGEQLYLNPSRCYRTYKEMAQAESKLPKDQRIDFVSIVTPNDSHYDIAKTFLEAFATIYCDVVEAIRRHIDGNPMKTDEYKFPTVYDGLRGMQFICKAVDSSDKGAVWVELP